jgi:hypothetical protein
VKTSILLAALVFLFPVSSSTQEVEYEPTVDQCQAAQAAWLSKMESAHGLQDVITVPTLHAWGQEMRKCAIVDELNYAKYKETQVDAISAIATREFEFIKRHGLLKQFQNEDAAGQPSCLGCASTNH